MTPDFVALGHEHERPADFETAALEALNGHIGYDAAFVLVAGQERYVAAAGLTEAALENLRRHSQDYAAELAPVKAFAFGARGVALDTSILGQRRVLASRYHREVAQSVSGQHSLLAYLRRGARPFGLVVLGRSSQGFSAREVAKVESCLPTLSVARASYGAPWVSAPLPEIEAPGLWPLARRALTGRIESAALQGGGSLVVRDRSNWREMAAGTGRRQLVWTRVDKQRPSRSGWPYADLLHVAAVRARSRRRALFVGCGGGVSPRQFAELYPGIEIDIVEREQAVLDLAVEHFALGSVPGVSLHLGDGRTFVTNSASSRWDVVILDAFDHQAAADGFSDAHFIEHLHRVLQPGGTVACNLIDTLNGTRWRSFVGELGRCFHAARIVPVVDLTEDFSANAVRNLVVIADKD